MPATARVIPFPPQEPFDIFSPNRLPTHAEFYAILHEQDLRVGARFLYFVLVWYRNTHDIAFLSKQKIMEIVGWCNQATLDTYLNALIEHGYLRVTTREYFYDGRKAKEFRYHFPKLSTFRSGFLDLLPEHRRTEKNADGEDLKSKSKTISNPESPSPCFPQPLTEEKIEEKPETKIAVIIEPIPEPEPIPEVFHTPIEETPEPAEEPFLNNQTETREQPENQVIAFQEDLQKPLPMLQLEVIEQTKILEQTHPGDQPSPSLSSQSRQGHSDSVKILVKIFGYLQVLAALKVANQHKIPLVNPGGWIRRGLKEGWIMRYVSWFERIKQAELDRTFFMARDLEKARREEENSQQVQAERARLDSCIDGLSQAERATLRAHAIQRLKAKKIPETMMKEFLIKGEMRVIFNEKTSL